MSTQFVQCVGSSAYGQLMTIVWPWKSSLGNSVDTYPPDSSPNTNLPFYQPKKISQTILPINIHMAPGPRLRPALYYNHQI